MFLDISGVSIGLSHLRRQISLAAFVWQHIRKWVSTPVVTIASTENPPTLKHRVIGLEKTGRSILERPANTQPSRVVGVRWGAGG